MSNQKTFVGKIFGFFKNQSLLISLIILCTIIFSVSPVFLSSQNLRNVLIQISINAFIAIGMTFVIISGGIDLSVGSIAALSGIVAAATLINFPEMNIFQSVIGIVGLSLVTGAICGGVNGCAIAYLNVPPFVATLAMMNIARGVNYLYTNSRPIYGFSDAFSWIGQGYIGFIPVIVIFVILVIVLAHITLEWTVFGRYVYAVGSNEDVAKLSGINSKRIKLIVYVISGILSAFAGACLSSRLASGQPTAASGYELNAIAAVVLGSGGMAGGRGGMLKTLQGILIIGVINNGLNLMKVSSYWQTIAMGVIILLAIVFDQLKSD